MEQEGRAQLNGCAQIKPKNRQCFGPAASFSQVELSPELGRLPPESKPTDLRLRLFPSSVEQSHRLKRSWCWHSRIAILIPWKALAVTWGASRHIFICSLFRVGVFWHTVFASRTGSGSTWLSMYPGSWLTTNDKALVLKYWTQRIERTNTLTYLDWVARRTVKRTPNTTRFLRRRNMASKSSVFRWRRSLQIYRIPVGM